MTAKKNSGENTDRLKALHGQALDRYRLSLEEVKRLRLSGWRGFKLYLQNPEGRLSREPVIKGIHSRGGKDGVKPWMDLDYREELEFETEGTRLSLSEVELDHKLFKALGNIIPPGGHLMVSYEGRDKIHEETVKLLSLGVPPSITPLGWLIFMAGFQLIKNWYLAEGGFEGPRKLWGEKAPDERWEKIFLDRTGQQVSQFLERRSDLLPQEEEEAALRRAGEIMGRR